MKVTHGGNIFAISAARGWDWREVLDFSANINPLGPAPGVRAAIVGALDRIVHYPDAYGERLAARLAREWHVAPEQVMVGNGATELLHFLARVWPQREVSLVTPAFSEFHRAWPEAIELPWRPPRRWPTAGLVVATQPNNPAGQAVEPDEMYRWLRESSHPVLIDESFLDFTGLESAIGWTRERPNLLVLRSLTKFHALPGLRVGALVGGPETMAGLRPLREPWQVNVAAEAAALAAVEDSAHARRTKEYVDGERAWMLESLGRLKNLTPANSRANFLLLYMAGGAADLRAWLLERKVLIRDCTGWPGVEGEAVRVAVRTRPENERLIALLEEYMWAS